MLEDAASMAGGVVVPVGGPPLPMGKRLELPGRGTTFVRQMRGPEGAPTLLLLHGYPQTWWSWRQNWWRCRFLARLHAHEMLAWLLP